MLTVKLGGYMKQNNPTTNIVITAIVIGVIAASAGFFGGMKYQQSKRDQLTPGITGGQGRMGGVQNGINSKPTSRPVYGEIIKADKKTITIQSRDGSSKLILLTENGQIFKAVTGSVDDLLVGSQVSVFGTPNPDGSFSAENIQIASVDTKITPVPTK